jgi:hypothetical protein
LLLIRYLKWNWRNIVTFFPFFFCLSGVSYAWKLLQKIKKKNYIKYFGKLFSWTSRDTSKKPLKVDSPSHGCCPSVPGRSSRQFPYRIAKQWGWKCLFQVGLVEGCLWAGNASTECTGIPAHPDLHRGTRHSTTTASERVRIVSEIRFVSCSIRKPITTKAVSWLWNFIFCNYYCVSKNNRRINEKLTLQRVVWGDITMSTNCNGDDEIEEELAYLVASTSLTCAADTHWTYLS